MKKHIEFGKDTYCTRRQFWKTHLVFALQWAATGTLPPGLETDEATSTLTDQVRQMYIDSCHNLQRKPSADVLIRLGLGEENLVVSSDGSDSFKDLDLEALVALLKHDNGRILTTLRSLDLSGCWLGLSGILLVATLLEHPACNLERIDLSNQPIGPEGMSRLAPAIKMCTSLHYLGFKNCHLSDGGGKAMVNLIRSERNVSNLHVVNLQNNYISYSTCLELSAAVAAHHDGVLQIELMGNRVLDEVFNSISHGVGELLSIIGTVFLMIKVRHGPAYEKCSMAVYCVSLNVLYLCSTLFHSFFALGRTVENIFKILDHSAIFILIAGSYTPFLGVVLRDKVWARYLLALMWVVSFIGIFTGLFYHGTYELALRLTLYLVLGWTAIIVIKPLTERLGADGTFLLILGGCLYTGGVPFFIKGRHTLHVPDHTIWHSFVVAASVVHFICIYRHATLEGLKQKDQSKQYEMGLLESTSGSEAEDKGA